MKPVICTVLLFSFAIAALGQVEPPQLKHANLVTRNTTDLAAEVHRIVSDKQASWTAYAVPSVAPDQQMCCFNSSDGMLTSCGCALEGQNGGQSIHNVEGATSTHLEARPYFYVFLRSEGGTVQKVRSLSADCPIDADDMTVYWLGSARAADSVAFLASLVGTTPEESHRDHVTDGAIMAIAYTNDSSVDQTLDRFLAASEPSSIRKRAAFWTAQMRGKTGLQKLIAIMHNDSDEQFRAELTFDISQSKQPEGQEELLRVAHQDQSPHVRGQALFWLAQKAGKKIAGAINDAIENDPDTEVKKRAVFALTQMPEGGGIPLLIQVAKTNTNPAVRKQAVFWLGQSHDPRALDFIESVLTR
jgi:phosphoribosyl-AMP cyclohydrolase